MRSLLIKLKILLFLAFILINQVIHAQPNNIVQDLSFAGFIYTNIKDNNSIQRVDSIAKAESAAKYFAGIYCKTMQNIENKIETMNESTQNFIRKFETNFANYFLNASYDHRDNKLAVASEWNCLFLYPDLQPWQLILLGVNAHTNIDMWQALVNNFTEKEIRQHKKQFLSVQTAIAKVYRPFFEEVMDQSGYLKFVNSFTKGFAKIVGERLVYKWRRRNVNLSILYYHNPEKFKRKLAIVDRKKQRIDKIIIRK